MNFFLFCLFTAFFVLSVGLYQFTAGLIKLPTFASTKTALALSRQGKKKANLYQAIIFTASERVSKIIHLDAYRQKKIETELKAAGIAMTPETWLARAYVKSGFYFVSAVLLVPIFPLFFPILLLLGIRNLFRELKSAEIQLRKKRAGIEADLPRFTATIAQELKSSRNVLAMLEGYLDSAGPGFRSELEITVADMRSGPQETALTRLETRVGSTMMSDVVRGLLSVMRGDDGIQYFGLLSHDFDAFELQKLKLEAAKRPTKVRIYSGLLLACFMLTYAIIIIMQVIQSANMFQM